VARLFSLCRITVAGATELVVEVAAVAQNITQCRCGSSNDGDG